MHRLLRLAAPVPATVQARRGLRLLGVVGEALVQVVQVRLLRLAAPVPATVQARRGLRLQVEEEGGVLV